MGDLTRGRIRLVAVGRSEEISVGGERILTAFRKRPVPGGARADTLGLEGDQQADLTVHGGPDQAVYAYPYEHYAPWTAELGRDLTPPAFGENLVVEGLLEDALEIGDRLRTGEALFEVTQPRMPCRKLAVVHGDRLMTKRFAQRPRPGFYLRVLEPGHVNAGATVQVEPAGSGVGVLDVYLLRTGAVDDEALARRALGIEALGQGARSGLERRLGV